MHQFTYTASPWGVNAPGWTVFQYTAGFEPAIASHFQAYYAYENLNDEKQSPRKLIFVGTESHGQTILSQGCDCGLRWWDTSRGKNYFTHVYLGDTQESLEGLSLKFNPMAWYGAECFQEDQSIFSKVMKETSNKELSPRLDTLEEVNGLVNLKTNPEFEDEKLFTRCERFSWLKIGMLVKCMYLRIKGESSEPLVFNAQKHESIDIMAIGMRLLPFSTRKQVVFSTWFTSSEKESFPEKDKLLFYGTIRDNETDDLETGFYGELLQGEPKFKSRKDAELFMRLIDAGGTTLKAEDFDDLVRCWNIATRRTIDLEVFRSAMAFVARFPSLKNEIEMGLASSFSDYNYDKLPPEYHIVSVVAWFEFQMATFKDNALSVCSRCLQDFELLGNVIYSLNGDESCIMFLNSVSDQAEQEDAESFANKIIDDSTLPLENFVTRLNEGSFLGLVLEYRRFYSNLLNGHFTGNVDSTLQVVNILLKVAGPNVKEIKEVKMLCEYHQDIAKIHNVEDVQSILNKYIKTGFPVGVNARKDICDRLKPQKVYDIVILGIILDTLRLNGKEMICDEWGKDRQKISSLEGKNKEFERLEKKNKKRSIIIATLVCIISIFSGFLIGLKFEKTWPKITLFQIDQPSTIKNSMQSDNTQQAIETTEKEDEEEQQQGQNKPKTSSYNNDEVKQNSQKKSNSTHLNSNIRDEKNQNNQNKPKSSYIDSNMKNTKTTYNYREITRTDLHPMNKSDKDNTQDNKSRQPTIDEQSLKKEANNGNAEIN